MPSQRSYPGVYIDETSGSVRTITGVATAIAAFVGIARTGPLNEPITVSNFGDFERRFGGLWEPSEMSFAVQDYFMNGGSQAIIVRVDGGSGAAVTINGLTLTALESGDEGRRLSVSIEEVQEKVFNLTIQRDGLAVETFVNVPETELTNQRSTFVQITGNLVATSSLSDKRQPLVGGVPAYARGSFGDLSFTSMIPGGQGNDVSVMINKAARPCVGYRLTILKHALPVESFDVASVGDFSKVNSELIKILGTMSESNAFPSTTKLTGGADVDVSRNSMLGSQKDKTGIYALAKANLFTLLCIPQSGLADADYLSIVTAAALYCEQRRAMLILDAPAAWISKDKAKADISDAATNLGTNSANAAVFFPRINRRNPFQSNEVKAYPACGAIAGLFARTDAQRGIWKAPAGIAAGLVGTLGPSVSLTDADNGELNPLGCNCIRSLPSHGTVVWGSRTLQGNDQISSQWKYIPVRRMALFLEESLYRGTQWAVFEPNDEPLWSQIRLNIGSFMQDLFRQGAFQGSSPKEAYFVKCDHETTTQSDIDLGILNIVVGFAPLKPAEFVILKFQQITGQV